MDVSANDSKAELSKLQHTKSVQDEECSAVDVADAEKLQPAEEEVLGAERLLLSGSDDEDDENVAVAGEGEFELIGRGDENVAEAAGSVVGQAKVNEIIEQSEKVIFTAKMSRLIDSESEEDEALEEMMKVKPSRVESDEAARSSVKTKYSALIDSDSEDEQAKALATDSEEEKKVTFAKKPNKSTLKKSKIIYSDSEEEANSPTATNQKSSTKFAALVDTDDNSTDADIAANTGDNNEEESATAANNSCDENEQESERKNHRKKSKPMRVSAKKAMDEMQTIQSEQQRLHREAHISIPYHKPKRRTLQEFLKRRTIIKPQLDAEGTGSPAAAVVQSKRLKMTSEELAEYAKLMEERAQEATEFFKSDSESEEKELKDNEGVMDTQQLVETTAPESIDATKKDDGSALVVAAEPESTELVDEPMDTGVDDAAVVGNPSLIEDEPSSISDIKIITKSLDSEVASAAPKVLITEVIELPKLDLCVVAPPAADVELPLDAVVNSSAAENSAASTSQLSTAESVKRLITEHNLPYSPSLKGDPNMLIDLETGDLIANEKPSSGADNLLQRLLETHKARKHKSESLSILSTENGKIEISKLPVHSSDEMEPQMEHKPGAAYLKLKENLKSLITKKRLEELQKKQEEEREHEKCLNADSDDEELEEYEPEEKPKKVAKTIDEIVIDVEENPLDGDDDFDEDEEIVEHDENNFDLQIDDEDDNNALKQLTDDSACNSDEDEDDEEEEEDVEIEPHNNEKSKNRIVRGFQDDSDDEVDFLRPHTNPNTIISNGEALYNAEPAVSFDDAQSELLGLCSGKFSATPQSVESAPIISQIPMTQMNTQTDETEQLLGLCSGSFGTQPTPVQAEIQTQPAVAAVSRCNKIFSSDEENSANVANSGSTQERIKKLTKRMKKRKAKLGFSDDEDDNVEVAVDPDDAEETGEAPATFIDYDSEENEIVVEMTSADRIKHAQGFFEQEAELSESEWGSADEDEKNMDKYDIELGDEDEFDREQIRTELGQIHARKMLDDDIREVRKLQEMLFEDEEQDGVGRQRQFKWKNAESGFSLEETNRDQAGGVDGGDSGDEENEHLWRKIRFEREQILKERGLIESSQDHMSAALLNSPLSSTLATVPASTLTLGATSSIKKLNIITAKQTAKTTIEQKKNSPFLIKKGSAALHVKSIRGSFLVRDKETLTKLAGLTKNGSTGADELERTAGTVSVKAVKSKNFVFATLTEEEHETLKRKADDLINSSTENGVNYMKKPKREPRREKCLIDQLL